MSRTTFRTARLQPEILEARDLPSCWAAGMVCNPPPHSGNVVAIEAVEQGQGFRPFGQQTAVCHDGLQTGRAQAVWGDHAEAIHQPIAARDQVMATHENWKTDQYDPRKRPT